MISKQQPKNWEIPTYEITFENPKSKPFSLVIPVINEGDRILCLLERMRDLKIADLVDIVIVDGGSTDGSLEPSHLQSLGVNTLLLKTGPGKLSAQLRCAYSFSLLRGYKGVVTIDGNNKDDPKAIPAFIDKLNEGYDFVQASRFIPGGEAVNTPLSRNLAIKLIHAPLLSLASGFHWTDTTQGFRAYSAQLLSSEKISIFRNIFQEYELLAYLSYIAPKLSFNCIEIPSSRTYPVGKVPTKISTVRGNIKVLCSLIKACLGYFGPLI
ncbi:glycosyltransferase [Sutterella sp. CAG:521]|nr:glycosyltransferase [Sutterella sp. CAG:521]